MREILFRGKSPITNEFVIGDLFRHGEQCFIAVLNRNVEVDPETVGQYTGLTDKNGTRIFEGDICWFYGGEYYSGCWEQNAIIAITDMTDDEQTHYLNNAEYCEIIGNIYDNPELLEC